MPGEQHVGGFYKNEDQLDLTFTPLPPTYPEPPAPPGTPQFLTRPETHCIFYGFDQYVTTFGPPDKRGNPEGWGFFGRAGIADGGTGNPNFGAWFASAGIGGSSPLKCRRKRRSLRYRLRLHCDIHRVRRDPPISVRPPRRPEHRNVLPLPVDAGHRSDTGRPVSVRHAGRFDRR